MDAAKTDMHETVVGVYEDHSAAEDAVRRLQKNGIPMENISIIGKKFQTIEKPIGFVPTGTVAREGAMVGAWTGGIFGLLIGAAFLILPGVGPVIVAGPLAAALLSGVEGALAGATFGGLTGALVGLGISRPEAILYEAQVKAGKLLVTVHGSPEQAQRALALFTADNADKSEEVVQPVATTAS